MRQSQEKTCAHCRRPLHPLAFPLCTVSPDGLDSWCRDCIKERKNQPWSQTAAAWPRRRRKKRAGVR